MNKRANIFFILSSISGKGAERRHAVSHQGYFQQLIGASLARSIYTIEGFRSLARQLAVIARHAARAKQVDAVEQATQVMLALPIRDELESVVRHHQALCLKQRGDFEGARRLLERVAEEATPLYRARALQVIGATHFERGEVDSSLPFYVAAGKVAADCDLLTLAESQQMIAVVRSIHGDHKQALADLEKLFPLVRAVGKYLPALYYDFLNSLAVELGEAGRVGEAEAALSLALASPLSSAYPNWSETRAEIAAKRISATPSIVAVSRASQVAPSSRTGLHRKPKLVGEFTWYDCNKTLLQRSSAIIAAVSTIPPATHSILEQVLISIGPRAPPVGS